MKRSIYAQLGVGLIFVGILFFGIPNIVYADTADVILSATLNPLLFAIIKLLGGLTSVFIELAINIGTYNDFLNAPMVVLGWRVMRDVCNVGFIIGMLAIAFGTILKIQTYHYKSLLMKLLLMAILINFSKTITGLLIDFSQVVMGTFMFAIRDTVAGNFIVGLGLEDLMVINSDLSVNWDVDAKALFTSGLLAVVMLVFAAIIVFILFVMLLFRVIALWVLVILSPIAYLAQAIPSLKQYGDRWWKTFTKYLVNGPVIAFFLWLVLSLVSFNYQQEQITGTSSSIISQGSPNATGGTVNDDVRATVTEAGSAASVFDFVTMIALLLMTLMIASESGAIGSEMAGGAISNVRGIGNKIGSLPGRAVKGGLRSGAGYAAEVGTAVTGVNMSPSAWAESFKAMRAKTRKTRMDSAADKARARVTGKGNFFSRGIIGSLGDPKSFIENYMNLKTIGTSAGRAAFARRVTGLDARKVAKNQKDIENNQNTGAKLSEAEQQFNNYYNGLQKTKDHNNEQEVLESLTKKQDASRLDNALHKGNDIDVAELPAFKQQIDFQLGFKRKELRRAKQDGDVAKEARLTQETKVLGELSKGFGESIASGTSFNRKTSIADTDFGDQIAGLARKGLMVNSRNDLRAHAKTLRNDEQARKQSEFTNWAQNNLKDDDVNKIRTLSSLTRAQKDLEKDTKAKKQEISLVRPDEMFYSRMAGYELMNDENKKIQHIQEPTELLSLLEDANRRKDKYRAGAILRKLAKEGNQNDFLNAAGYKSHDITELHAFMNERVVGNKVAERDNEGNIKKDKQGNALWMTWKELKDKGLAKKYRDNYGVSEGNALGMEEQTALSLQQDICFSAEGNNQFAMARGVAYEDGRLVQLGSNLQSDIVVNQMGKHDAENLWRRMSRLGIGGEDPGGTFHLGQVGLKWLMTTGWTAADRPILSSKNANQNLIANLSSDKSIRAIRGAADRVIGSGDRAKFDNIIDQMQDLARVKRDDVATDMHRRIDAYLAQAA